MDHPPCPRAPYLSFFWVGKEGKDFDHVKCASPFFSKTANTNPSSSADDYSQRTDFERGGTGGNGVVCDGGVAAREHDVRLAGDGCGAVRCGWHGEGESSVDGGCAGGWVNWNSVKRRICV